MAIDNIDIKTIDDKLLSNGIDIESIYFSKSEINKAMGFLKKAIAYKTAKDCANYSAYFAKFEHALIDNKKSKQQEQICQRITHPAYTVIKKWALDQMLEEKFKSADILYKTILADIRSLSKKSS